MRISSESIRRFGNVFLKKTPFSSAINTKTRNELKLGTQTLEVVFKVTQDLQSQKFGQKRFFTCSVAFYPVIQMQIFGGES